MPYNITEENYYEKRYEMVEKNANLLGVVLRDKEKELEKKLKSLVEECKAVCGGEIPCDIPVIANQKLWRTGLYAFCKALPKGADLHLHGSSLMPVWRLIKFLSTRNDIFIDPETFILYTEKNKKSGYLTIADALDDGIIDRIELERKWTVLGADENQNIWRYFEDLFSYHAAIDEDFDINHDYYVAAFEDSIKNGIFHLELHVLLSSDISETEKIVTTIRNAYYKVKKDHPYFTVRIIGASMKMFGYSVEETEAIFKNTAIVRERIKDDFSGEERYFVIGFDLINEEDTSRKLSEFAPMLLKFKRENPDFKYFLHCGESLDHQSDNLIDAYLIGSTRVGHGMNLFRYPDLLRHYVEDEVCLEVCPISNQTLRYTHDLRLHPGAEYLKRNVTVSICSDDAIYQEHEQLVDDFFAVIVAWGLGVAEIKQLCINSIIFSALDEKEKMALLKHWHNCWNRFIEEYI